MEMVNNLPAKAKRKELPNIINHTDFINDLQDHNISTLEYFMSTEDLKPTQSEFNNEKVTNLLNEGKMNSPIIISNDNFIVDGHHRWKARADSDETVAVLKVELPYEKLKDFLQDKPYVRYKELSE